MLACACIYISPRTNNFIYGGSSVKVSNLQMLKEIEDPENAKEIIEEQLRILKQVNTKWNRKLARIHWCPHCRKKTEVSSGYPYCPACGWDSISDDF